MKQDGTLIYYNKKAADFIKTTQGVDFHQIQDIFLSYLPEGASILDFGCGSGRDAKCFKDLGYQITAVDGSEELCKAAAKYVGIPVRKMLFQELDDQEKYDGIWAFEGDKCKVGEKTSGTMLWHYIDTHGNYLKEYPISYY